MVGANVERIDESFRTGGMRSSTVRRRVRTQGQDIAESLLLFTIQYDPKWSSRRMQ